MDIGEFKRSLDRAAPPEQVTAELRAIWQAAKGAWDKRPTGLVQDEEGADAAWAHAHLHRIEGDLNNAG